MTIATTTRLDCETPESALSTFCSILGLEARELQRRFDGFDLDTYYPSHQPDADAYEVLHRNVLTTDEQQRQPASICWFHATRALPGTDFERTGIQPTTGIAPYLWDLLRRVDQSPPSEVEWQQFRESVESGNCGHYSRLYQIKTKQPGPFGFLIREELFHFGQTHSVDYFGCPETVEDICLCYEGRFSRPLVDQFKAATRPCIVKFVDARPARVMDTVGLYLYRHHRGEPAFEVNTCFDGRGTAITPAQIKRVEWP